VEIGCSGVEKIEEENCTLGAVEKTKEERKLYFGVQCNEIV